MESAIIRTVNVIIYSNDTIESIFSFYDNSNGNKLAEKKFIEIASTMREYCEDECSDYLSDGFFIDEINCSQVFIVHS